MRWDPVHKCYISSVPPAGYSKGGAGVFGMLERFFDSGLPTVRRGRDVVAARRALARKAPRSAAELRGRLDAKAGLNVEDLRRRQKLREAEVEVDADAAWEAAAIAAASRKAGGVFFGRG